VSSEDADSVGGDSEGIGSGDVGGGSVVGGPSPMDGWSMGSLQPPRWVLSVGGEHRMENATVPSTNTNQQKDLRKEEEPARS
jgi:hypothetical protein